MTIKFTQFSIARMMSCLVLVVALIYPALYGSESVDVDTLLIAGFDPDSPDLGWYVQNDNVMGGRSQGGFVRTMGELVFSGYTNTNGGGFSSIRTRPLSLDLNAYTGIGVKVKADGRRYTLQLKTNALWHGRHINYWADFATVAGETNVAGIPFSQFMPQFRGTRLDGPALDASQITEIGLYIYDRKEGPFELRLISIEAYSDMPLSGDRSQPAGED
jgi:NADH dehydrogenase [ubiquinone] 1 alpha subcomplex assembly factor 1